MWPVVVLDDVVFPAQSKQYHDVTAWREGEIGSSNELSYPGVRRACMLLAVVLRWRNRRVMAGRESDGGEAKRL